MSVFNEPSLTTQTRISADGTVQFPLIGEVKLGGMPIRDARELVRRRYNADYLVEPQVYLNVLTYAQRRFTVLGQVNRPGTYDFPRAANTSACSKPSGWRAGSPGWPTRTRCWSNAAATRRSRSTPRSRPRAITNPLSLSAGDVITVNESWF